MVFLQRVLDLIDSFGISKNKLLTDLGINKSAFVDWDRRSTIPSGDVVAKIADYFHVSTDYLLGRTDDPRPVAEQTDPAPVSEGGTDPLDARLNELLPLATDETKRAMIVLLEQTQKQ